MKFADHTKATIRVGADSLSVRRHGRSETSIAKVLGRTSEAGIETLWLDRLIHRPHESRIGGEDCPVYEVDGAFVSVLRLGTRQEELQAA